MSITSVCNFLTITVADTGSDMSPLHGIQKWQKNLVPLQLVGFVLRGYVMSRCMGCKGPATLAILTLNALKTRLILMLCLYYLRCVGYLFQKVGKVAATSVGGGLLLLQVFVHK